MKVGGQVWALGFDSPISAQERVGGGLPSFQMLLLISTWNKAVPFKSWEGKDLSDNSNW